MTSRNIAVIGAGAIGGTVAGVLADRGHRVTLCVRTVFDALTVDIAGQLLAPAVEIETDPSSLSHFDWLMVATKIQDTQSALPWLSYAAGPQSRIAVLQNGIDHVERVRLAVTSDRILPTLVHVSAELLSPGYIKHHSGRRVVAPAGALGEEFACLFQGSLVDIALSDDFLTASWLKLFGNVAVAPITALTLCRVGILQQPDIREFARSLLEEAVATGKAAGAKITLDDMNQVLASFDVYDPKGGSSMLYDRQAGRPLEHEHLTGALVRTAERWGVQVPLNRAVLALLRGIDAYGRRHPDV